jgi:hypothetical protein
VIAVDVYHFGVRLCEIEKVHGAIER